MATYAQRFNLLRRLRHTIPAGQGTVEDDDYSLKPLVGICKDVTWLAICNSRA